jgi:hypothetical protein
LAVAPGSSLAEFRMNANSDATWMNAATNGFKKLKPARIMPTVSTAIVPAKYCQMI